MWANAQSKYAGVGVAYDIEVSTPTATVYTQTVGESPDFGAHILPFDTEFDTVYSWRVRARVGNEFGPWANWAEFLSHGTARRYRPVDQCRRSRAMRGAAVAHGSGRDSEAEAE